MFGDVVIHGATLRVNGQAFLCTFNHSSGLQGFQFMTDQDMIEFRRNSTNKMSTISVRICLSNLRVQNKKNEVD